MSAWNIKERSSIFIRSIAESSIGLTTGILSLGGTQPYTHIWLQRVNGKGTRG